MNNELWHKILQFDFDHPTSEYGFSTRLANENYWTKDFTEQAILAYKKFMYLAASSEMMVSPSEIVDTVWHQHLIFTVSYQEFCELIGKQIQHIPSMHSKEDFQKFKQAKERTKKLYEAAFGVQPRGIWDYSEMFESLNLQKATLKLRSFLIIGILTLIALIIPCYFLLKPIYFTIGNPDFLIGFVTLSLVTLILLELLNKQKLKQIVKRFDENSFIFNLEPFELVYLQSQNISNVVNGTLNELIENKTIRLDPDDQLSVEKQGDELSTAQAQVTALLSEHGPTPYQKLLRILSGKPVFWNVANAMDAFKKYVNKSKAFGQLFYINFGLLSLLLLAAIVRFLTGILRDRPVSYIGMAVIACAAIIVFYLIRLTKLMYKQTIPNLYKTEILPARHTDDNWQWSYFLLGTAVLTASFVPLVHRADKNADGGNNGASCGSSCGSSCNSCGGCGGD